MNTYKIMMSLATAAGVLMAQDPPQQQQGPASNGGWRRIGDTAPAPSYNTQDQNSSQNPPPNYNQANVPPPSFNIPPQLTVKPGTYLTVRINQLLSSDQNQAGDAFSATLVKPLVVDGVVVAERGQVIGGRVAEAKKAGRVSGVSRLTVQLTELTVVDGQQLPIQAGLITRNGQTAYGRDATAIGVTTATGAAIGAGVNGGVGAGVGAAAGLVASTIGVLFTRGYPTVITPESVLTFSIEAPVTISTERTAQAFRYVDPHEYDRPEQLQTRPPRPGPGYGYPPPPPPYYYGGYYPGFYFGPSFVYGYGFGPRFYSRGYYYRGYHR